LIEKPARLDQSFLAKHNGLCFAARIADQSLFVQPVQGLPIEAFPRPGSIMQTKIKKSQYSLIYPVVVKIHNATVAIAYNANDSQLFSQRVKAC
jgi:hypothetical protein